MRNWRTVLAALACLSLLAAGASLAGEKWMKVMSASDDDEKQIRVEVVEEDGESHVKVWEIQDGEEVLIKEYDADSDEDVFFMKTDDHDFAWHSNDGAYLGVQLSELNDAQAEYFKVKDGDGALVTEVVEDSAADEAGFMIYDVIVKIDGDEIDDPDDAIKAVHAHEKGDEIEVVVRRKGKNKKIKATLGERPEMDFAYAGPKQMHMMERMHDLEGHHKALKLHREHLTPHHSMVESELDNLRADVEELRAMLEDLKAKQ